MTQAQTLDAHDIAKMSNEELSRLEREIARRHIDGLAVSLLFFGRSPILFDWLSLWPLVLTCTLSARIGPACFECLFQYLVIKLY